MRNEVTEELRDLRDSLDGLMNLVDSIEWKEPVYFYRFLDTMKNNIEIWLYTPADCAGYEEELDTLKQTLNRDWEAANDEYLGISSYGFWTDCADAESESVKSRYFELVFEVESYFHEEAQIPADRETY
jgi:hypothetical protein